jgi:hypothetical protein
MTAPRLVSAWFGAPIFERMARVLGYTAAVHCPDWDVRVVRIEPEQFEPSRFAKPGHVVNTQKMAAWAAAVEQAADGDRLLLIDADCFIANPLTPVWDEPFDMAYTVKPESRFPFNSGVVFLRVGERVREFVRNWWNENLRLLENAEDHRRWNHDYGGINQAALGSILHSEDGLRGMDVRQLPCRVWNCEDSAWREFDPASTRIVHVKSALRRAIFPETVRRTWQRPDVSLFPLASHWKSLESRSLVHAQQQETAA